MTSTSSSLPTISPGNNSNDTEEVEVQQLRKESATLACQLDEMKTAIVKDCQSQLDTAIVKVVQEALIKVKQEVEISNKESSRELQELLGKTNRLETEIEVLKQKVFVMEAPKDISGETTASQVEALQKTCTDEVEKLASQVEALLPARQELFSALRVSENLVTRKVEWRVVGIRSVLHGLQASKKPGTSVRSRWFSPAFDAAGLPGTRCRPALQLELRYHRPEGIRVGITKNPKDGLPSVNSTPNDDFGKEKAEDSKRYPLPAQASRVLPPSMQSEPDCSVLLWAPPGISMQYRVYLGHLKSSKLTHTFERTNNVHGCIDFGVLRQAMNHQMDTVTVGVEILTWHKVRTQVAVPGKPDPGFTEEEILSTKDLNSRVFTTVLHAPEKRLDGLQTEATGVDSLYRESISESASVRSPPKAPRSKKEISPDTARPTTS